MTTPDEDLRDTLRVMISHEDDLRDQRLGYLLTLNGLLFAALGFAWSNKEAKSLVLILSVLGFFVALGALAGMTTSDVATKKLRDRIADPLSDPPIVGIKGDLPKGEGVPRWAELF